MTATIAEWLFLVNLRCAQRTVIEAPGRKVVHASEGPGTRERLRRCLAGGVQEQGSWIVASGSRRVAAVAPLVGLRNWGAARGNQSRGGRLAEGAAGPGRQDGPGSGRIGDNSARAAALRGRSPETRWYSDTSVMSGLVRSERCERRSLASARWPAVTLQSSRCTRPRTPAGPGQCPRRGACTTTVPAPLPPTEPCGRLWRRRSGWWARRSGRATGGIEDHKHRLARFGATAARNATVSGSTRCA